MTAKARLRRHTLAARDALPDRAARSRRITGRVLELPELAVARSVAAFIGVRSEVVTDDLVARCLALGKRVVLPKVTGPEIELIEVRDLAELADGPFGLREPAAPLAGDPARRAELSRLDLLLIPGVAFDRAGGRLGHGKGYYDRLLRRVAVRAARVGLAFECQLAEQVPMGPSDEPVDLVVTEDAVYRVSPGRRAWTAP